jgi:hypothetical protein
VVPVVPVVAVCVVSVVSVVVPQPTVADKIARVEMVLSICGFL